LAALVPGTVGHIVPGTVGAVARDGACRFAAATSTGGTNGKRAGRVGDSPLPGAGTWADERCAISATGHGESIIRSALAHRIATALASGVGPREASLAALAELRELTDHDAGVIVVDGRGWSGIQLSRTMPIAWIDGDDRGDDLGDRVLAP
jgi:beta-aspartyl-peptidase (threonine type)